MKLVVLGGGESGVGAALLGRHLGYEVFLSDKGKLAESYRDELITHRIAFEEGQHSMDRIFAAELVVKSPGIPDTVPMVVALRERGIEVISEIEFAGRHTEAKMMCIRDRYYREQWENDDYLADLSYFDYSGDRCRISRKCGA